MLLTFKSGARLSGHRPRPCVVALASKKANKGSKGGVSALAGLMKKKAEAEEEAKGSLMASGEWASPAQYRDPEVRGLLFALATSYHKATKQFLVCVMMQCHAAGAVVHLAVQVLFSMDGSCRSMVLTWNSCQMPSITLHSSV